MAQPTFWQKIRYWLRGEKVASALSPLWDTMQPQYAMEGSFSNMVTEGYRKNELIYACIMAKAKTAQQIAIQVLDGDGDPMDEHPLLDLLHRPNDYMNESDFWASVTIYQALAGRATYEIEYARGGMPVALWPLRPDWIMVKQAPNRPAIEYYTYNVPGKQAVELDPKQVLDFPLFDPLNRFKTYPPVAIAGRVGDVDNAATDLIKLIFEHGGMPMGYLKSSQVILDDDVTEIQERWGSRYGGWRNWIKPAVLDRDADFVKLTMNLSKEMGFADLDSRSEARICLVLDVPPILVGAKVGLEHGTYSNYETARRSWWEDTVLAMYSNYMDVLEYKLLPIYAGEGDFSIGWDTSKVYAFSENENEAWARATAAWEANAITLNEFCLEVGLEEKGEEGEKYKSEMTTPPALTQPVPPNVPGESEEAAEGEDMADEMEDEQEDMEEMKFMVGMLAEIKAIRAEIKQDNHDDSAMVALYLPYGVAKKVSKYSTAWPAGSEVLPASELHVTLAYLGKIPEMKFDLSIVQGMLSDWSERYPGELVGRINGIGRFNETHRDGYHAVYANFDCPGLADLRQSLFDWLKLAGLEIEETHGFTPHITLAYVPAGSDTPDGNWDIVEFVKIPGITLAWGNKHFEFEIKPDVAQVP